MTPLEPAPDGYAIKLVRDRTPEIVNPSGQPGQLFYRPMPDKVAPWLRRKLSEEVAEYLEARTLDELAQVLSVVDALAQLHGSSLMTLVDRIRSDPRGGFARGVIMYGRHPEYDQ